MENRFGVKDFALFALLAVVIVLVSVCMVQYDRQWEVLGQANAKLQEQTRDLAAIRKMLDRGVPTARPTTATATTLPAEPGDDLTAGFERILNAHAAPDYAPGDAVVATFQATPAKLTPLISLEASASEVQGYVLDSLLNRDPTTLKWTPGLARSYRVSDDQLTIDFDLRRGVTFSDGEPMTADDVVFTMDFERNPDVEDPRAKAYLDKLDRVEKTGDYGVRFVFKEPYFKSFETLPPARSVLSRKFYSQFGSRSGSSMSRPDYCSEVGRTDWPTPRRGEAGPGQADRTDSQRTLLGHRAGGRPDDLESDRKRLRHE